MQPSNDLNAIMFENDFIMRRFRQFTGEILSGEVQVLMQAQPPFWTICDIVDDAVEGDKFACAAFACVPFQFRRLDNPFWIHGTLIVIPSGRYCCMYLSRE